MKQIYLDHAAATPLDDCVLAVMQPYFADQFYNPSATYLPAQRVRETLDGARRAVAEKLGVKAREIVFVAGGSEGNNLAVAGVMAKFPNCSVTISGIEHDSVRRVAERFNCSAALTTEQGRVDLDDLRRNISEATVLVSIMYANNEVGTVQPIREIAKIVQQIRNARQQVGNTTPLYLHTDACQAANYLNLQVARLGVDLMTLNGGKIYGPKQSGVLYVGSHVQLAPLIYGGGQERGIRSGTESVAGAIGFAAALTQAQQQRVAESDRLNQVKKTFFDLCVQKIPGATINGSRKDRLPNNLHITLP
ncbi:MAG: aminotransferase class V-fold PLP-dependent enzyme, partial [Candidatus Saccharimonadales bacterium]